MSLFNPKFFYKNYISDVSEISDSASTSDSNKLRLFDRNDEIEYVSSGATTGTRTITWTPSESTTVDRIILQGINWKDFTIKYDTSTDFSPAISVSGNSDTDIYIEVSSQAVSNIVFSVTDTFSTNQPIKVTEIVVTEEIMEFSSTKNSLIPRINPITAQATQTKSDGTTQKTYIRTIREVSMSGIASNDTERQKLFNVFNENRRNHIYFVPYPRTQSDVFDGIAIPCHWISGRSFENFEQDIEANGYVGEIILRQA